jgi:hypothetical protein
MGSSMDAALSHLWDEEKAGDARPDWEQIPDGGDTLDDDVAPTPGR